MHDPDGRITDHRAEIEARQKWMWHNLSLEWGLVRWVFRLITFPVRLRIRTALRQRRRQRFEDFVRGDSDRL